MEKDHSAKWEKDYSFKVLRHKFSFGFVGSIFLLVAAAALVMLMTGPSWFKNIQAEITNQPYARTFTVDGEGKISAKPDIANVSLAVVSKGTTVKQVTTDNNTKMNQVIAAVQAVGVDPKDITTSEYDLNPDYDYNSVLPDGSNKIIGYSLTQQITVKVRDLNKVDDVLDGGTKAGANQVGSLDFEIDDMGPVKQQARTIAFAAAKAKAQEMADEAGVSLGRIVTFSEQTPSNPVPMVNFAMEAKSAGAVAAPAPSIQPGQQELTLDVSVTYEIN
jgi:hypothetical protein